MTWSKPKTAAAKGSRGLELETPAARARIDNPLLRSGLVFAGANRHEGGIVTALEASGLDLFGTKLVVLSACDTGRGSLRRGEGMIGLARGFLTAGAPRVVVSNWKVEDRSTERFMVDFYKGMRGAGQPPGAALRAAKLARIGSSGPESHPFHWAAFVLWGLW